MLREFEGRSYKEIAEILNVSVSALETLLFRARRSLAEELEHQLTCTEAQFAVSQAADGRLGRKERRRLRVHLEECPDCAQFAQAQKRHRRALRGLGVGADTRLSDALQGFRGLRDRSDAARGRFGHRSCRGSGGAAGMAGGGALAGGVALKAAAVVTAAGVAGGVGVVGATETQSKVKTNPPAKVEKAGKRLGQTAPRGSPFRDAASLAGRRPRRVRRRATSLKRHDLAVPRTPACGARAPTRRPTRRVRAVAARNRGRRRRRSTGRNATRSVSFHSRTAFDRTSRWRRAGGKWSGPGRLRLAEAENGDRDDAPLRPARASDRILIEHDPVLFDDLGRLVDDLNLEPGCLELSRADSSSSPTTSGTDSRAGPSRSRATPPDPLGVSCRGPVTADHGSLLAAWIRRVAA